MCQVPRAARVPPHDWPPLCEEIESAFDEGQKLSRSARKAMERCLYWDGLWPAGAAVPDRGTVRAELQAQEFRPELD